MPAESVGEVSDDLCDFCMEDIDENAVVCRHCGAFEDPNGIWRAHWDSPGDRAILEIRNLIAGMLVLGLIIACIGLFAVLTAN